MNSEFRKNGKLMDVTTQLFVDVNFEEEMLNEQTVQAIANTLVPWDEGHMGPLSPSINENIEDVIKSLKLPSPKLHENLEDNWMSYLNEDIENNENIGNSGSNIEESETRVEISEGFLKSTTASRSDEIPEKPKAIVNSPLLQSLPWQHEYMNIGTDFLPTYAADAIQKTAVYSNVPDYKEVPSTSSGIPHLPSLAWQIEYIDNGIDFLLPNIADAIQGTAVSSNASDPKVVPSSSSGEPYIQPKPKLTLPVKNSKTSTKRGRPLKEPVPPSAEVLEQLPEKERKIIIQKYKNNGASRQSRQKKKEQERTNEIELKKLLKENENLKRKKAIIEEHSRCLHEKFINICKQ